MVTAKDIIQDSIKDSIRTNNYNGVVLALTGIGKAKIMVDIIKELNPSSVLYCCDNKDLRDTTFRQEIIKWGGEAYLDKITMACYQTTYKWVDKEFDLLLMDEGDFACTPAYIKTLTKNKFKNILVFTGTMSDDKKKMITKLLPIIHEVGVQEAEEKEAINKINVHFVTFDLTALETNKYIWYNNRFRDILNKDNLTNGDKFRLKQLQLSRKIFLQNLNSGRLATRKLLSSLYKNHSRRILVFCGNTNQADKICKWSYHSKNEGLEYLEKFNIGDIRVLSVVAKIDRGLNLNGVNTIIFESPARSKTKVMQRSGRGRRLGVDDTTDVYFMIPYFKDSRGQRKPSIIMDYVLESGEELNLKDAKTIHIDI